MFGLQHSFTTYPQRSRFHQDSFTTSFRTGNENINISSSSRTFGPVARNTTLTTNWRIPDRLKTSENESCFGGFRRPDLSKIIRGRSSTLSSRLFSHQNVDRYSKDLSNANGLNVTHISRRGLDTVSESRLGFDVRQNEIDNQSVVGSHYSVASAKAQFMNLLENLHHSILNIVPNLPIEAVRMEFDKVKQGLENITEMSFAPTIKESDAVSIISHSSKIMGPPISTTNFALGRMTNSILNGDSIKLKTGKDVLKAWDSRRISQQIVINTQPVVTQEKNHPSFVTNTKNFSSDDEQEDDVFKKPKPLSKWKRSTRSLKKKSPKASRKKTSENLITKIKQSINLKNWYPIATGTELAFCGVNEDGAIVKTDPVKKRVNNRKIELINGFDCNLIGSPSTSIALPERVMRYLKNGVGDRWRVMQKELLSCQTHIGSPKKMKSNSPKKRTRGKGNASPKEKAKVTSPKKSPSSKKKVERHKNISKMKVKVSPNKTKGNSSATVLTRSGRAVKSPGMFWIASESDKVSFSEFLKSPKLEKRSRGASKKQNKKDESLRNTESKKANRTVIATPVKKYSKNYKSSSKTITPAVKVATPKKRARKEVNESKLVTVHSSTNETKGTGQRSKRKREIGDDSIHKKKSKSESKTVAEAESTVEDDEPPSKVTKKSKSEIKTVAEVESTVEDDEPPSKIIKKRGRTPAKRQSPVNKAKSSATKKKGTKKKTVKESSHYSEEKKEVNDSEDDFESQLDDIEIPEVANISSKPQLSRSQLRILSMETPPLKYFNNNLQILRSATPVRSPDWCISQRTNSEVKQFQKRREEALRKKKIVQQTQNTVYKESVKSSVSNKELKNVLNWVAEKNVRTPKYSSKVLQYVIPSRKHIEEENEEEEDEEDKEISQFF